MTRRRLSRRSSGREPTAPPPLLLLLLLLLYCPFFPEATAEQQQGTEAAPPFSVVRLRSLEVGPLDSGDSNKRLFPAFPRLLLEQEQSSSSIPAPPPPDPRDERWGPLSRGTQAIVSFGGKGPSSSVPSSSTSSALLLLSASAAAVAAVERVGGTVSDSLPDDALLAVGLTEEALGELERDQAVSWLSTFEPEMKVAPEWWPLLEAAREMMMKMLSAEASAAAAERQGEPADDDASSFSSPALSRVPRAAAPFVYHLSRSLGGDDSNLPLVPKIDLVVSFPALLPKSPEGGGGGEESNLASLSYAPAAAAAESWRASLDGICSRATLFSVSSPSSSLPPPARCSIVGAARDRLVVSVPLLAAVDSAPAAAPGSPSSSSNTSSSSSSQSPPLLLAEALVESWASRSSASHWISPRARPRQRNAVAAGLAQSGLVPPGLLSSSSSAPSSSAALLASSLPGAFPLWEAGLRGQGQVLGMGDTGLDFDHCLFVDPELQPPLPPPPASSTPTPTTATALLKQLPFSFTERDGTRYFASSTHRKLNYYRALSGDAVDGSGHGTHCAGSAVGSLAALGNLVDGSGGASGGATAPASHRFEGMAPAAKLAFTDIGAGAGGDLSVPVDLVADYFPYHYNR